jgi:ribose transport system ATP-binding protein
MTGAAQPVVTVRALSKHFGAVHALENVDLELFPGEVHGIVGENGAGKSTFMKILAGVEQPTSGTLAIKGQHRRLRHVVDALAVGIVMIHQELNLVDELTVAENVFLGREPTKFGLLGIVDRERCESDTKRILARMGHDLNPSRQVRTLSIADKQMVEIAKALSYNADILIMDEPTATLTEREAGTLSTLIGQLRAAGATIVFISHILPQVLRISDRITVLRDGRIVTTLDSARVRAIDERALASLMVGRPMAEHFPRRQSHTDRVVLSVESLCVADLVQDVSFDVRAGEIFGLAGLIGAGRTETAEAIMGLRAKSHGMIRLDGAPARILNPVDATGLGVAYLPEDRKDAGLTLGMDVVDNTTMVSLRRYSRILLDRAEQERATQSYTERMHIRVGALRDPVSTLSGGNQQKVLLAKWLEIEPKVLIIDEPTRGVDIGAKEEIYNLLRDLAGKGMACVMISSEINELLGMCHRIGVMRRGRLVTILNGEEATEEQVIHAASLEVAPA